MNDQTMASVKRMMTADDRAKALEGRMKPCRPRPCRANSACGLLAKFVSAAACAALAAFALSGCVGGTATADQGTSTAETPNPVIEQSATEIGTYEKIDTSKTQLVIGISGSEDITAFVEGFEQEHPDVQPIVVYLQVGSAAYSPANEWVRHGYAPDIVFNLDLGDDQKIYQVDLTDTKVASSYNLSSLTELSSGGRVYELPGPSKFMGIAYNKTLFDRYGWQTPKTFDEFLALCDRITADTGGTVVPYNANAKYAQDYVAGLEGFSYGQLFSGVENAAWYDGLIEGDTTFSGHMEPFFDMVQKMVDHGALNEAAFDFSYTTRNKEFAAGGIAMINEYTTTKFATDDDNEIAFMPFPSTDGNSTYLATRSNFTVCETVRDRSDAQAKAAEAFLEYISSPEGQRAYIGDTVLVSHVDGVATNTATLDPALSDAFAGGRVFERINFAGGNVPGALNMTNAIRDATKKVVKGSATSAQAAASLDETLSGAIADPASVKPEESPVLATASADFSVLQTSEYEADMFRDITGADIALIPDSSIYRGNIHRMFAGDLTKNAVINMLPRSFENGSTLVKVEMTGQQLLNALDNPPDYNGGTSDCIYAFSGLKATVAPTEPLGSKYVSVTLADGSAIEPAQTYTVAFWKGMVSDGYIGTVVQTYEGSFTDLLAAQVSAAGTLAPIDDGRLTLKWQ